jgi:hypothetical protein
MKLNGRPRKHSSEKEYELAVCFIDAKKREPWLTQADYARNYGISARSLRRYIKNHAEAEGIKAKMKALEEKKKELERMTDDEDVKSQKMGKGWLMTPWY